MIDFVVFALPTWVVVALVVLYVPGALCMGMVVGRLLALNNDRSVAERSRRDVADRAADREHAVFARDIGGWRR